MLGKQHGYYTEDAATNWRIDSTIDALNDLKQAMYKFHFEADEEKKKAGFHNFVENTLPPWLAAIDKRIAANSSHHHIVGDKITIADFAIGGFAFSAIYNDANPGAPIFQEAIEKFPHVKEYLHHLRDHEFHDFLEHRPKPR